jgi:hypothetical protein
MWLLIPAVGASLGHQAVQPDHSHDTSYLLDSSEQQRTSIIETSMSLLNHRSSLPVGSFQPDHDAPRGSTRRKSPGACTIVACEHCRPHLDEFFHCRKKQWHPLKLHATRTAPLIPKPTRLEPTAPRHGCSQLNSIMVRILRDVRVSTDSRNCVKYPYVSLLRPG